MKRAAMSRHRVPGACPNFVFARPPTRGSGLIEPTLLGRSAYRPRLSGRTTIAPRRVDAKTIPRYFLGVQRGTRF
jgi:hypothetical protein